MLKSAFYGRNLFRVSFSSDARRSIFFRPSCNVIVSFSPDVSVLKHSHWLLPRLAENGCLLNGFTKFSYSSSETQLGSLSRNEFELICNDTLESLSDYFEELIENCGHLKGCDVTYSDGVLTVQFGNEFGTYVINRQTPNRQVWLSSPTSGPKRYDFVRGQKQWIYRHDNKSLHELLQQEIPKIVKNEVNFYKCAYSGG